MKTKILSILSLLCTTAILVNAQEATTYRGAFAPAPAPMWTDNWTNWDPQNTFYPTTTVIITANTVLTGSVVWTRNNTYKIQGLVYVDTLATLTIEPGTVIRGDEQVANSSLIVQRGGKLIANGTPCDPIVFTSNKAAGARAKGDWGGVILLGKARNNLGQAAIEGIQTNNPRVTHGGTDDADNSGSMKYVRIEYAGFIFSNNNEINALTFGSVGSGTAIDYIQASFSNDDAYEWFGGSVNAKHLVAYRCLDDDLDTDNGFSGLIQFALIVKDPAISDDPAISTSEGFESDNDATGTTNTPKTSARFYNITQIGAFRCGSNSGPISQPSATGFRRGVRIRRQSELKIYNSIFLSNWRGLFLDNGAMPPSPLAEFKNNIIAMDTTTVWATPYTGRALAAEGSLSIPYFYNPANLNTAITTPCDVLVNAWDFLNPDYRPNSVGSGGVVAGTDLSIGFEVASPLFSAGASSDMTVDLVENGIGTSNGTITISIPTTGLGWDIKVPGSTPGSFLTLTAAPQTGFDGSNSLASYTNSNWLFSVSGGVITITSKAGVRIAQSDFAQLGLVATRKAGTPNGTNQNVSASLSGGGDNNPSNDGTTTAFGAN
ncbi:MAG TPA: hypothetical protein VFI06_14720 [Chitinophagaceae bacterium]|nr:hypothetical protein [Chitinophagaceae bacterium]